MTADDVLDVVLALDDVETVQLLLGEHGFVRVQGAPPKSFVMEDTRGRSIDVHLVRFDPGGNGVYRMENEEDWIYPAAGFAGMGLVAGHHVRCLTPEVQMLCHTGYEFSEKDVQEVLALQARFGVDIPEPYRERLRKDVGR